MSYTVKQISFMEKVIGGKNKEYESVEKIHALRGQRVDYQLAIRSDAGAYASVSVDSLFPVSLFAIRDVPADAPMTIGSVAGDGYLIEAPGLVPDVLVPIEDQSWTVHVGNGFTSVWVQVDVPKDAPVGESTVSVTVKNRGSDEEGAVSRMGINVIAEALPDHGIRYTRWFYADCVATAHGVEIFSDKHWDLIDKYIAAAVNVGINMILVPVHTPPLDTEVGATRPCVQLVDVEYSNGKYSFNTEKLDRFIRICKKHGVRYYEIAHMFSQWGAAFAPNIMVTENGVASYKFGWHVPSNSPEYAEFLGQYIPEITAEFERHGVLENTYFHISDEPGEASIDIYRRGYDLIHPLVGSAKIFDALSHREFWEKGIVKIPVTYENNIHEFLECPVEEQWVYYCCFPQLVYPNTFIAMPSYRVRAIGIMIYKYDIKGFLQWGFNSYNSFLATYSINPYLTTSADGAFPSGDPFIVYPAGDNVYGSIRGEVMRHALDDIAVCRALEEKIGRDAVVSMIDNACGAELRFDVYPRSDCFYDKLREDMISRIGDGT